MRTRSNRKAQSQADEGEGEGEGEGEDLDAAQMRPDDGQDSDDDEAPQEVSIKTVRTQARQQRKREQTAKESAAKADKAKRRRYNRQQDGTEGEKQKEQLSAIESRQGDADTLPQELLNAVAEDADKEPRKKPIIKTLKGPRKVGPVEVIALPEPSFDFPTQSDVGGERESATTFWQQQFQGGEQSRSLNSLKGFTPNMIVQPRRSALYGPHVDFR